MADDVRQQESAEEDPLVGRQLDGRYTVTGIIGRGGMGKVYKAVQAPLDRVVALKVLSPSYDEARDPGFVKRFFLEASVTAKLSHPNTITIFDYGRTQDGIFYIAMEHLAGRTLSSVLASEGALPPLRALSIAAQIARSVREAHGLGIVHRDLKPANVMLSRTSEGDDFVKVLDFGLVKFFDPSARATHKEADENLTVAGTFMGSPHYIAPEQARNLPADPRSDIYSLGVLLWQLLVGKTPFSGKTPIDIIMKHISEQPLPPSRVNPHARIPVEVDALALKMMAKDPARRHQSMDEVLEAMKAVAGTGSGPAILASAPRSAPHVRPPSGPVEELDSGDVVVEDEEASGPGFGRAAEKRGLPAWIFAAAAVAALGAAGAYFALRPKPAPPAAEPAAAPAPAPAPPPAAAVPAPSPAPAPVSPPAPVAAQPAVKPAPRPAAKPARPATKKKQPPEGYKDDPY